MCAQPFTRDAKSLIIRWANRALKPYGKRIQQCKTDCQDGTIFLRLIETVTGEDIGCDWKKNPVDVMDEKTNIKYAIQFLEENGLLQPDTISIDNVMWGREEYALTILDIIKNELPKWKTHPINGARLTVSQLKIQRATRQRAQTVKEQTPPVEHEEIIVIKTERRGAQTERKGPSEPPSSAKSELARELAAAERAAAAAKRAKVWDIGHDPRVYSSLISVKKKKEEETRKEAKRAKIWDIGHDPRKFQGIDVKEERSISMLSQLPALMATARGQGSRLSAFETPTGAETWRMNTTRDGRQSDLLSPRSSHPRGPISARASPPRGRTGRSSPSRSGTARENSSRSFSVEGSPSKRAGDLRIQDDESPESDDEARRRLEEEEAERERRRAQKRRHQEEEEEAERQRRRAQ